MERTWDGLPISPTPPYGAAVVVWCRAGTVRFLLLRRAHLDHAGARDWAWGPPAGARLPDEDVLACARRELSEETGLTATELRAAPADPNWAVFHLELRAPRAVRLSAEHDAFLWASSAEVTRLVWPERVRQPLLALAREVACRDADQ